MSVNSYVTTQPAHSCSTEMSHRQIFKLLAAIKAQYIYQDRKLLAPVVYFALLVYGQFGQINMHSKIDFLTLTSRWVSVVEFHDGSLGISKVFGQESTVVKWNYQILGHHPVAVRQKVPILDFQSEFSMSKTIRIFLKKNSLKNINLGAPFL